MKDKMILTDGTGIELEAGASLSALQVSAADRAAMLDTWDKLTPENLAKVQIQTGDGLTVGTYNDLLLVSETSVDALEAGQAVQDGAIEDLGTATSNLADQIGGVE